MPRNDHSVVYPLQLCEQAACLQGTLPIAGLPRLRSSLHAAVGEAAYWITCDQDSQRCCRLQIRVVAELLLVCQRCLQGLPWLLETNTLLAPVQAEQEIARLPDTYEPLLLSAMESVTLADLVEEELILGMPLLPKHADACGEAQYLPDTMRSMPEPETLPNPFAVLHTLKKLRISRTS